MADAEQSKHAERSPSGAAGWMECAGWQSDSTGSKFADEGTDAHEVAANCLTNATEAATYKGVQMGKGHIVNDEMVLAVQDYVDYVRGVVAATNGTLLVEQRLPITDITGEPGAHGTSDVVILAADELIVIDLKYGRGVPVDAADNPQLQIYALAALTEFGLVSDFKQVRMVIHQPRIGSVSEWVQTVDELKAFGDLVKRSIDVHTKFPYDRNPGDKQCRWCARKATCLALAAKVQKVVGADFNDMVSDVHTDPDKLVPNEAEQLATALAATDLIEVWIKAVRAEVETRLMSGIPVPGFKLVQGKRGHRAWSDKTAAESLLKDTFRLKVEEMYDLSLISPTSAEKLSKTGAIGPRQWIKVQSLITQPEGKPSVAPESDKRPALVMSAIAEDFDDVTDLA
jgi:hypothetical protein